MINNPNLDAWKEKKRDINEKKKERK